MAAPAQVPDWMRPEGLPTGRMPSRQALQRLIAGNTRHVAHRAGEPLPPGVMIQARFPFALVIGCLEAGAAAEELFDQPPGAVLCARSAGPSLGEDMLAAADYAALVFNVGVLLVLGHRGCTVTTAARNLRAAGDVALPGSLPGWRASAAEGTADPDHVTGHVAALVARLGESPALFGLLRSGQLVLAGGVLDASTGAIEFLPQPAAAVETLK